MSRSHVLETDPARLIPKDRKPRVLVTGAAGRIGSYFCQHDHDRYNLRMLTHPEDKPESLAQIAPLGELVTGNITNLDLLKEACRGMDVVLHLAANPNASQVWEQALPNNVIGTYNIFAAAKSAGVRKVIFASSVHSVSGYDPSQLVRSDDPVNPGDLYGVTKCFGEAMARYMAEQEGVSTFVLRIGGWFPPEWQGHREWLVSHSNVFVSARDLNQLFERCIDDRTLRFAIFNAISANANNRLDISDARELVGYRPQDDVMRLIQGVSEDQIARALLQHSMRDGRQESGLRNNL